MGAILIGIGYMFVAGIVFGFYKSIDIGVSRYEFSSDEYGATALLAAGWAVTLWVVIGMLVFEKYVEVKKNENDGM